ncbi:Ribokinase-like protein [Xylaria grammica]|nr:Ribokinase-like protein [Xylaria grammica]
MGQKNSTKRDLSRGLGSRPEPSDEAAMTSRPCFVSMGILSLDEIHYPWRTTKTNVLGGAGLWATFGARLFKLGESSTDVGYIIVARNDVPTPLYRTLESWGITLVKRYHKTRGCTRTLVDHSNVGHVAHTNEPIYPTIFDLDGSALLWARSFHFLGLPSEVRRNIIRLLRLRAARGLHMTRPIIVWEPAAGGCERDNLESHFQMLQFVDVFSPNHNELSDLTVGRENALPHFSRQAIEEQARLYAQVGIGPEANGLIVVRCGRHGCFYMRNEEEKGWIGTYYDFRHSKVQDVTGAGSAFLGAFTAALVEGHNAKSSCCRGTIAASFALEQFGLPEKENYHKPKHNPFNLPYCPELWNDDSAFFRLSRLELEPGLAYQNDRPVNALSIA